VQRHIGWQSDDFDRIATTHRATSLATAPHAGPVLIEDTDPLQTRVWQKHLLDLTELTPNTAQTADLYLLLAPDTPWINDGTRYQETTAKRMGFHTDCLSILRQSGVGFCEISGDWQSRQTAAKAAITDLLTFKGPQT
jgi:nicotinamide riboside kinase